MVKWPLVFRSTLEDAERDNDRLRIEASNLRRVRIDLEGSNNALRKTFADLQAEIKSLSEQLHKAQRNDHHDPKTGRFVSPVVLTTTDG